MLLCDSEHVLVETDANTSMMVSRSDVSTIDDLSPEVRVVRRTDGHEYLEEVDEEAWLRALVRGDGLTGVDTSLVPRVVLERARDPTCVVIATSNDFWTALGVPSEHRARVGRRFRELLRRATVDCPDDAWAHHRPLRYANALVGDAHHWYVLSRHAVTRLRECASSTSVDALDESVSRPRVGDHECLEPRCTLGRHHRGICNAVIVGKRRRSDGEPLEFSTQHDPARHAVLPAEAERSCTRLDTLDDGREDTVVRYRIEQIPNVVVARYSRWPHSRIAAVLDCVSRDDLGFVARTADGQLVGRARYSSVAFLMASAAQDGAMTWFRPGAVVPWLHMMVNDSSACDEWVRRV